nr:hypothetical protein [uncultured Treponema sp.]
MGKTDKKQNQSTDEKKDKTQAQTVENQQPENPAQADSGDTQPPVTPPAGEKDSSEEQPEGGGSQPVNAAKDGKNEEEKVKLTLRHKSHTQHYYRCGLMLTKVFAEYEVAKEAVAKIKADKWIEIKDCK